MKQITSEWRRCFLIDFTVWKWGVNKYSTQHTVKMFVFLEVKALNQTSGDMPHVQHHHWNDIFCHVSCLQASQFGLTVKASVCWLILGSSRLWNRVKWFDLTSNTLLPQGLLNRPLLVQKTLKETKRGWMNFFDFLFFAQIFISLLHIDLFLFICKRYNLQSNGSVGCSLLCSGQCGHNDEGRGGRNAKQEINTSGK